MTPSNRDVVASKFAAEIKRGRVVLLQGRSEATIPQLPSGTLDMAYVDTTHTYNTTATELRLLVDKLKPTGMLCGHDYTHGSGSPYYDRRPWRAKHRPFEIIEAVNEFLMYHPGWFMPLRTSSSDQGQHTSFCLARWKHFPHALYERVRESCDEVHTVEHYVAEGMHGSPEEVPPTWSSYTAIPRALPHTTKR